MRGSRAGRTPRVAAQVRSESPGIEIEDSRDDLALRHLPEGPQADLGP
ncbi:hypothetical protein ACWD7F_30075 [Streptomyces sp. NPDC005122]